MSILKRLGPERPGAQMRTVVKDDSGYAAIVGNYDTADFPPRRGGNGVRVLDRGDNTYVVDWHPVKGPNSGNTDKVEKGDSVERNGYTISNT